MDISQQQADGGNYFLKQLIQDAIACGIAGFEGPGAKEIMAAYTEAEAPPQATVLLSAQKQSVYAAATINTFLARAYTFDDTYEAGVLHPGAPIIMSSLALGEYLKSPIQEILTAIAAGYEIACDCAYAINPAHYTAGFHPTGTCNGIGVAAAAARLLGLNLERTTLALRLAADMACGYRQYQLDGDMVNSALHAAKAAGHGIESAFLARQGFAGPGESISGNFGLFKNMAGGYNEAKIFDNRGKRPRYMEVSIKPFPSCRYMHGGVDAVIKCLSQNNLAKEAIKKIRIQTYALAKEEGDRKELGSVLNAQFSLHYNIGAYLIHGGLGIGHFTEKAIQHPEYQYWADKITVEEDPELSAMYPAKWPYRAIIETDDGKIYNYLSSYPPGAPENPMETAEIRKKWQLLMEPVIGAAKTERLIKQVENIEKVKSVEEIWQCTR
ncbi:MAG: MmgE/PrpD family protein [Peptococcaceae bacterium]|nr:MmgE/PrpD family protein [Peptococcaceae bacterium]